jgi:hypothetical protein
VRNKKCVIAEKNITKQKIHLNLDVKRGKLSVGKSAATTKRSFAAKKNVATGRPTFA